MSFSAPAVCRTLSDLRPARELPEALRAIRFAERPTARVQGKLATLDRADGATDRPLHYAIGNPPTPQMCRADDADDLVIGIDFGGSGAGWIGTHQTVSLASTEVWMFDYYSPSVIQWSGGSHRALHIDLPRATCDTPTLNRVLTGHGER
jgi:hypothetical protein